MEFEFFVEMLKEIDFENNSIFDLEILIEMGSWKLKDLIEVRALIFSIRFRDNLFFCKRNTFFEIFLECSRLKWALEIFELKILIAIVF